MWIGETKSIFKVRFIAQYFDIFLAFSFFTLLLISIERYLAICRPMFHHKKVTKTFLIKLHFFLLFIATTILCYILLDIVWRQQFIFYCLFFHFYLWTPSFPSSQKKIAKIKLYNQNIMVGFQKSEIYLQNPYQHVFCQLLVSRFVVFQQSCGLYSGHFKNKVH